MISILLLAGCIHNSNSLQTHVQLETMIRRPSFQKLGRASATEEHDVVFAIKQQNMDRLQDLVLERSTPGSPQYQQWLTVEEVRKLTRNEKAINTLKSWLSNYGLTIKWTNKNEDYIRVSAPIVRWEEIFKTKFYQWSETFSSPNSHSYSKEVRTVFRSQEYSLPIELMPHIHSVLGTCQTPLRLFKMMSKHPNKTKNIALQVNDMTISTLSTYYNIPVDGSTAKSTQSVFETSGEAYSANDLAQFQSHYGTVKQQPFDVNGQVTTNCVTSQGNICGEGNLDIQYIMGMSQFTGTIYFYETNQGVGDPFLNYLTDILDSPNPSYVNSISWGSIEKEVSTSSLSLFENEAMKLAAAGFTILAASGDDGVANSGARTCDSNQPINIGTNCACLASSSGSSNSNSWVGTGYFPNFPASSPYVTAVGATQGPESNSPETVASSSTNAVITSGGGFSTVYPAPSWQSSAISSYFNAVQSSPPAQGYNNKGRGYPDVSMVGVYYPIIEDGSITTVFGTSASTPLFAAMLSTINAKRIARGLGTVGFINPTIYKHQASFTDVTTGNNKCAALDENSNSGPNCCNSGFSAAVGWDPASGLGSIQFPNLYNMLITLNSTANSAGAATFNPAGGTSASYYSTASPSSQYSSISKASSAIIAVVVVLLVACLAIGLCQCFMSQFRHSRQQQPAQVIARQPSSVSVRISQSYPQMPVSDAKIYTHEQQGVGNYYGDVPTVKAEPVKY